MVDVWNRAFRIDYFEYRGHLQAIASASQSDVPGAGITTGLDDLESWLSSPGEEIIVPTDDGDFFQPGLVNVVGEFAARTQVVVWPFVSMGFPPKSDGVSREWMRIFETLRIKMLYSNNRAIRKSYLAREFTIDEARLMLAQHHEANERIADKIGIDAHAPKFFGLRGLFRPIVRRITHAWSLYNTHIGSISLLLPILISSEDPVGLLSGLDFVTPIEVPEHLKPFEPYVRRLERLTAALVG